MTVEPTPHPSPTARASTATRLAVAGGLAAIGLLALAVDLPVAGWFRDHRLPKELARYLNFTEVFGHGIGVAVIMVGAFSLDRSLQFPSLNWPAIRWPTFQPSVARRHAARMLGGLVAGPLTVLLLKQLIDRVRPRAADLTAAVSAVDTFGRGLLADAAGGGSDLQSFPSGHSATAAALGSVLIWKYPQGRWFFLVLTVSACLQRIASSAHYPSDACIGAAIGVAGAAIVLGGEPAPVAAARSTAERLPAGRDRLPPRSASHSPGT